MATSERCARANRFIPCIPDVIDGVEWRKSSEPPSNGVANSDGEGRALVAHSMRLKHTVTQLARRAESCVIVVLVAHAEIQS